MKAKDWVAQIRESPEYRELVKLDESASQNPEGPTDETISRIIELCEAIGEMINQKGEEFLKEVTRSCRPRDGIPTKYYASARDHVQEAVDAFKRQVKKQLSVFCFFLEAQIRAERRAEAVSQMTRE